MTNKTEDKFYFGKPGQPERFSEGGSAKISGNEVEIGGVRYKIAKSRKLEQLTEGEQKRIKAVGKSHWVANYDLRGPKGGQSMLDVYSNGAYILTNVSGAGRVKTMRGLLASRPGQPERFAAQIVSKRGTKRTEIKRDATGKWAAVLIQSNQTGVPGEPSDEQVLEMKWYATEANARTAAQKMLSARSGQPDKFDASSLERGSFAEASKSPILGKLLSEKAMPEGGWRAVQAGSDTLVISFEDGDVAGNFARRVAGKGYSATSPVQAIGRYWNVEVKNG